MAHLLDGKTLALNIRNTIKHRIASNNIAPGLAVVLVGDDPASHTYVRIKEQACHEVGITFKRHSFPADTPTEQIIDLIHQLNAADAINGILVQLPLPSQDTNAIIAAIDPKKDVDGFHPENKTLISPVALGVMKLLSHTQVPLAQKTAVLVCSELFGQPMVTLLREEHVMPHLVSPSTINEHLPLLQTADVLITATGMPGSITGSMIKEGALVIDIGTTKIDGTLYGDVDVDSVSKKASWITPVPGGVGPMTVAMLMLNVLRAWNLQQAGSGAQ